MIPIFKLGFTLHSLANVVLKKNDDKANIKKNFIIFFIST